jgi:hypothetical protein
METSFQIETIKVGGADQVIKGGSAFTASFAAVEEIVAAIPADDAKHPLHRGVIDRVRNKGFRIAIEDQRL